MRGRGALIGAAVLIAAAPAAAVPTEVRIPGWPQTSLAVTGSSVAMAWTGVTVYPEGYRIHRVDTALLPMRGADLRGTRTASIALRTSAGPITRAWVGGDARGRHLLLATGRGFLPQLIHCCRANGKDYPVESSSRAEGPVTIAATIDGPQVRFVQRMPDGTHVLVTRHVDDAPGAPFGARTARPLDALPLAGRLQAAPGLLAWVDARAPREIRVATVARDAVDPVAAAVIPLDGDVLRLHATPRVIVAVVRDDTGVRVVRFDAPAWSPVTVWRGTAAPGPTAAGDRTVLVATGRTLRAHVPGGPLRPLRTLRVAPAAIATDGRRAAVVERIATRRGTRRILRTAVTVTAVPGAPVPVPEGT